VSLAAFARERGLDVKRLYSWRQRLEQSADSGMGLAQVRFAAKVVRESVGVVVVLPNGIRVELPTDWDASAVAAFCEVLRC